MEKMEEKRRRFFYTITMGNIFTIFSFIGAAFGLYMNVIEDVRAAKQEIVHIKEIEAKKEVTLETSRKELKQEVRDVKEEVKSLNEKLDKLLFEVQRNRRN